MLVIYDNAGTIYFMGTGKNTPIGIPYVNVNVPNGKYLVKIDTSKSPHEPIFEDYPKTEMEILKEANDQQRADIDYLLLMIE